MGTMGFGLPAAVGAQFAQRSRLVIDIDGDASIRMNLGELETVTTYDLPVKVVVLNNCGDGMVKQWQKLFFKGRLSASDKSLHTKDFVKAALADGFKYAVRLDKKADVPRVIAEFVSFPGPGIPRGDDRSGRGRVSDGRPRTGLRRDDHGRAYRLAHRGRDQAARRLEDVLAVYQTPVFGMLTHGSAGCKDAPCCSSSTEIPSGERTNAMRPSRGGRLMVTPCFVRRSQVA